MRATTRCILLAVFASVASPLVGVARARVAVAATDYAADVAALLDTFEKEAGALLAAKGIDWAAVRKEFTAAAKATQDDEAHVRLCVRLIARLRDGHAGIIETKVRLPEWEERFAGPRVHLVPIGKGVFVRKVFGDAEAAGVRAGDEVLRVDDQPVAAWLDARIAKARETTGFGTDAHARYEMCHVGLGKPVGEGVELTFRGGTKTLVCDGENSLAPVGYVAAPAGAVEAGRQLHAKLTRGKGKKAATYGWIHLRDVPDDLETQLDAILAALGPIDGVILDMRANSGGGCDHEAVFGRFLAPGTSWRQYRSAGPNPCSAPMVVIVDAGVVSAGETVAGQFKEDGRAYMIGESGTAGMSSQKKTVTVPSGMFTVRYSWTSNKGRFNGGKGIEGIGVPPHEVVAYDPKELASGLDTMIRRAADLLEKGFPKGVVPYVPPKR